jgi:hypothetical protein
MVNDDKIVRVNAFMQPAVRHWGHLTTTSPKFTVFNNGYKAVGVVPMGIALQFVL